MPDMITGFEYVATLIIGGLLFFFLNWGLSGMLDALNITNDYFNAGLWIWSLLPLAIFGFSSIRAIRMAQRKRERGY